MFKIKKLLLKVTVSACGLFALFMFGIYAYNQIYFENKSDHDFFSAEIIQLHEKYDKNNDGLLDLDEFEPLGHRILSIRQKHIENNEPADGDEEFVTLNSFYEPVVSDLINNKTYAPVTTRSLIICLLYLLIFFPTYSLVRRV